MLGRAAPLGSDSSDNLITTKTPQERGFCFPAIRQGYSRDALHQYPCHSVGEFYAGLTASVRVGQLQPENGFCLDSWRYPLQHYRCA